MTSRALMVPLGLLREYDIFFSERTGMYVTEDICTVEDLQANPTELIQKARKNRRPMVITADGKPVALLLSTELFPTKEIALNAACELAGAAAK